MNNNQVLDVLKDQIKIIAEDIVTKSTDQIVQSAIKGRDGKNYIISINGSDYSVPNGTGFTLAKGQKVWVTIPKGNYSKMFISSNRNRSESNLSSDPSSGEGVYFGMATEDDIINMFKDDSGFDWFG